MDGDGDDGDDESEEGVFDGDDDGGDDGDDAGDNDSDSILHANDDGFYASEKNPKTNEILGIPWAWPV